MEGLQALSVSIVYLQSVSDALSPTLSERKEEAGQSELRSRHLHELHDVFLLLQTSELGKILVRDWTLVVRGWGSMPPG